MNAMETLQQLAKALEAGGYNAAPGTLTQGSALQIEDLSPVMNNVTFQQEHIKLQKMLKVTTCKNTLAQFDRQLSYGIIGASAQIEGAVGQEETSDFIRAVVPMCYFSHTRRVTVVSNMVATVDGMKAEERAASDAAIKLAGDIEFQVFRGAADYSNTGAFDGNLLAISTLMPDMHGLDLQVRSSDAITNTQDLMFAEFGSSLSVVINGTRPGDNGTLSQNLVEDASTRSALNFGTADKLMVDPMVLSAYNKLAYQTKERIWLANGSDALHVNGADMRKQWVMGGGVNVEASNFLRGKFQPARARATAPAAPTHSGASSTDAVTALNGTYYYYVTAANELGESAPSVPATVSIASTHAARIVITPAGSSNSRYFNVYRGTAGGSASTCRFIGRVTNSGASTTTFYDFGNKLPGFVTGFLIQGDTMELAELSPYSRLKLAVSQLSIPEAHFRFVTLKVTKPRMNVLIDNLVGSF